MFVDQGIERPEVDPVEKLLLDAANLLEREGWTTGSMLNSLRRRCVRGAIRAAAGYENGALTREGFSLLQDAELRVMRLLRTSHHQGIEAWNDREASGAAEVIAMLRAAATGAKWEKAERPFVTFVPMPSVAHFTSASVASFHPAPIVTNTNYTQLPEPAF